MSEFLILIGGPGLFQSCDPKHDKAWLNYFYPMKVAGEEDLYHKTAENVSWVVYEPAYKVRWLDDDEITLLESIGEFFSGSSLHKVRKAHAAKISPAKNYLDYVQIQAKKQGITYRGINTPAEFWKTIASFPANSVSRVWYCGHATGVGFILELMHDSACVASGATAKMVLTSEIAKQASLKDRFVKGTTMASQFFGCHTSDFAESWTKTFGVPSEGAKKSITFAKVLTSRPSDILDDMKTTPTPAEGAPLWTRFDPDEGSK